MTFQEDGRMDDTPDELIIPTLPDSFDLPLSEEEDEGTAAVMADVMRRVAPPDGTPRLLVAASFNSAI
jgi:hypothetical protein